MRPGDKANYHAPGHALNELAFMNPLAGFSPSQRKQTTMRRSIAERGVL